MSGADGIWAEGTDKETLAEVRATQLARALPSLSEATLKVLKGKRWTTLGCVLDVSERALSRVRGVSGDELLQQVKRACLAASCRVQALEKAYAWFQEASDEDKGAFFEHMELSEDTLAWEEMLEGSAHFLDTTMDVCQYVRCVEDGKPPKKKKRRRKTESNSRKRPAPPHAEEEEEPATKKKSAKRAKPTTRKGKGKGKKAVQRGRIAVRKAEKRLPPLIPVATSQPQLAVLSVVPPRGETEWVKLVTISDDAKEVTELQATLSTDKDMFRHSLLSETDCVCSYLMEARADMVDGVANIIAEMAVDPAVQRMHLTVYADLAALLHQVAVNRAFKVDTVQFAKRFRTHKQNKDNDERARLSAWQDLVSFATPHGQHTYRPSRHIYKHTRRDLTSQFTPAWDPYVEERRRLCFPGEQVLRRMYEQRERFFPASLSPLGEIVQAEVPQEMRAWEELLPNLVDQETGPDLERQSSCLSMMDGDSPSDAEVTHDTMDTGEEEDRRNAKQAVLATLQEEGLATTLFDYQTDTVVWAQALERLIVDGRGVKTPEGVFVLERNVPRVSLDERGDVEEEEDLGFVNLRLRLDHDYEQWILPSDDFDSGMGRFYTSGGLLSDDVGLGKTLTMLSLVMSTRLDLRVLLSPDGVDAARLRALYRNVTSCRVASRVVGDVDEDEAEAGAQPAIVVREQGLDHTVAQLPDQPTYLSRATLLVAPSHLVHQWHAELDKHFGTAGVKVCVVTTLPQHRKATGWDLVSADLVLVSVQYFKGSYEKAIASHGSWASFHGRDVDSPLDEGCPPFHLFHFNRVVFDEAHELFSELTGKGKPPVGILRLRSRTRWLLTATPFPDTSRTLNMYASLLRFRFNDELLMGLDEEHLSTTDRTQRVGGRVRDRFSECQQSYLLYQCLVQVCLRRNTKESIGEENTIPDCKEKAIMLQGLPIEKAVYGCQQTLKNRLRVCADPLHGAMERSFRGRKKRLNLEELRYTKCYSAEQELTRARGCVEYQRNRVKRIHRMQAMHKEATQAAREKGVDLTEAFLIQYMEQEQEMKWVWRYEASHNIDTLATLLTTTEESIRAETLKVKHQEKCLKLLKAVQPMILHQASDSCDACREVFALPQEFAEALSEESAEEQEAWKARCERQGRAVQEPFSTFDADVGDGGELRLVVLECGHHLHAKCVDTSAMVTTCPQCKQSLQTANEVKHIRTEQDAYQLHESLARWRTMVTYGSKMARLVRYVSETLDEDVTARVVVFSSRSSTLDTITDALWQAGVVSVRVTGNVGRRTKALRAFQSEGQHTKAARVIMLSLETSASGADLTLATHLIVCDPLPGTAEEARAAEMQAIGRGRRQGMSRPLIIVRLIMSGTVEEAQFQRIKRSNSMT